MNKQLSGWRWANHQKRWFGKWHTYLGLLAGAIVSLIGVTGSLLTFQDEIDKALNPELFRVAAHAHHLSYAETAELLKKRHANYEIVSIRNSDISNLNLPYRVLVTDRSARISGIELFVNPFNGEITGRRNFQSSLMQVVTRLHMSLLLSLPGRILAGLSSLILLILIISGLRLWIPAKWKHLKSVLTINFSAGFKRQNYDWHNVIGFYTAPWVLMLCLTGFSLNIGIFSVPALLFAGGENTAAVNKLFKVRSAVLKDGKPISLERLNETIIRTVPKAKVKAITMPLQPTGVYTVEVAVPGKISPAKTDIIMVDQYSAKVLFNTTQDLQSIGKAYVTWLRPLHYGTFGGLPTKVAAAIAGLAPLALFITGTIIWWPRFRKRRSNKHSVNHRKKIPVSNADCPPASGKAVFAGSIRSGALYACYMLLIAMTCGGLYGLPSGFIVETAMLTVYMAFGIVVMNFTVASVALIASILVRLLLWKKQISSYVSIRYFGLSLSFLVVFLIVFMVLSRSQLVKF